MFLKAWELPTWETTPAPHRCTAPIRPSTNARGSRVPGGPRLRLARGMAAVNRWEAGPPPLHTTSPDRAETWHTYIYLSFDSVVSWKWQLKRKEYKKGKYILCQIKKKIWSYMLCIWWKIKKEQAIVYLALLLLLTAFLHLITALSGKLIDKTDKNIKI